MLAVFEFHFQSCSLDILSTFQPVLRCHYIISVVHISLWNYLRKVILQKASHLKLYYIGRMKEVHSAFLKGTDEKYIILYSCLQYKCRSNRGRCVCVGVCVWGGGVCTLCRSSDHRNILSFNIK